MAGKHIAVHRYAYERHVGPIPDGLQIDHICHNRICVEPSHLRAVTNKQNLENISGAYATSSTGVRGVHPIKGSAKYQAVVVHNRQHYKAGRYDTIAEAEAVVITLRNKLFTHNDADRARELQETQ